MERRRDVGEVEGDAVRFARRSGGFDDPRELGQQFHQPQLMPIKAREPHRIAFYLADVAAAFHAWYNLGNDDPGLRIVLDNDPELTATRLYLADGIGQVIRNGLSLMGVEALEEMN